MTGVLLRTGLLGGVLALQVPGSTATRLGSDAAFTAPYAIPVVRPYEPVRWAVARLRERIARAGEQPPTPGVAPCPPSSSRTSWPRWPASATEGVLTHEEFAHQERRLLGP